MPAVSRLAPGHGSHCDSRTYDSSATLTGQHTLDCGLAKTSSCLPAGLASVLTIDLTSATDVVTDTIVTVCG